ncbi:DUF1292 domain-containing protein [uncultured Selenomonas sp.]|uniref:DUF1292 domain-containing protein n=1 Tax=uncultured Selenomonas sp. TaxID=159275 RepID=UPI0028D32392|nr:DUF1292 domain-containing protein [uncultured Selenomonas sp.]
MSEHEELQDEDVIVVIANEEGEERYYREEMIIPLGEERFAVLIALDAASEEELENAAEGDEATIAKIITDEEGEDIYTDPSDEEFDAVRRAYELIEEED